MVHVKELLSRYTTDELNQAAESYFHQFTDIDGIVSKPFATFEETTELLLTFCHVLRGLDATQGMTILDFGAGSCWSSRYLTQLGFKVIATDVSPTALKIGQECYRRLPIQGKRPEPSFQVFNGHRFDLPDESVDRVMCLSAFHHVPNQKPVLDELFRVLKPGGIAGFSEPGPNHSITPQSQYEMSHFKVVENDIRLSEEIWPLAQQSGFKNIHVGIWSPLLSHVSLEGYANYLTHEGRHLPHEMETKNLLKERRLFFLRKGWPKWSDSSQPSGLKAYIDAQNMTRVLDVNGSAFVKVTVTNIGNSVWLPSNSSVGPVRLGLGIKSSPNDPGQDLMRYPLPASPQGGIFPGETVTIDVHTPILTQRGVWTLTFDLVSEYITWFRSVGSTPAEAPVIVR